MAYHLVHDQGRKDTKAYDVSQRIQLFANGRRNFKLSGNKAIEKVECPCKPHEVSRGQLPFLENKHDSEAAANQITTCKEVGKMFSHKVTAFRDQTLLDVNVVKCAKRVCLFFKSDGSFRPVPRVNFHMIRKRKQFCMNAVDEFLVIASRQICSTNTIIEQHVSADQHPV